MLRRALFLLALSGLLPAVADETMLLCHGYSCLAEADIHYSEGQLGDVRRLLLTAGDPAGERHALAEAIGMLYRWAGEQSDLHNDRGGNYADGYVSGRMDCIDHSTSTTRLLRLLEQRAYLRWHRVLEPDARHLLGILPNHWSAVVEEKSAEGGRFVVDSWFVNNGEPAVILPLEDWKKGAGPDV